MVLPHVSYSLSHCDGSLSIRIHSSFGWISLYPLWFWFASLSPSRFDGENLRQIPVGWFVSETTFNRYSF